MVGRRAWVYLLIDRVQPMLLLVDRPRIVTCKRKGWYLQ